MSWSALVQENFSLEPRPILITSRGQSAMPSPSSLSAWSLSLVSPQLLLSPLPYSSVLYSLEFLWYSLPLAGIYAAPPRLIALNHRPTPLLIQFSWRAQNQVALLMRSVLGNNAPPAPMLPLVDGWNGSATRSDFVPDGSLSLKSTTSCRFQLPY